MDTLDYDRLVGSTGIAEVSRAPPPDIVPGTYSKKITGGSGGQRPPPDIVPGTY